jgi:hypothetical protein
MRVALGWFRSRHGCLARNRRHASAVIAVVKNYLTVGDLQRGPTRCAQSSLKFKGNLQLKRCVMPSTEYYRRQAHAFLQMALVSSDREETKRLLGAADECRLKADNAQLGEDAPSGANAMLPTQVIKIRPAPRRGADRD